MNKPKPPTSKEATTYERSVAMHLDICAAQVHGRTWRLDDLLKGATDELTWDEVMLAIYTATGLKITNPTLRAWKARQEASREA